MILEGRLIFLPHFGKSHVKLKLRNRFANWKRKNVFTNADVTALLWANTEDRGTITDVVLNA